MKNDHPDPDRYRRPELEPPSYEPASDYLKDEPLMPILIAIILIGAALFAALWWFLG